MITSLGSKKLLPTWMVTLVGVLVSVGVGVVVVIGRDTLNPLRKTVEPLVTTPAIGSPTTLWRTTPPPLTTPPLAGTTHLWSPSPAAHAPPTLNNRKRRKVPPHRIADDFIIYLQASKIDYGNESQDFAAE
jgi:hypothetical protein